ncbi:MAG: hypothetical protein ABSG80_02315 [Verrucomicrobiota bacterium]
MKQIILLFLSLLGLQEMVQAQGQLQIPDSLQLNIAFSPLPNSPGTNQLSGNAGYFKNGWNYDAHAPATNVFSVVINLGTNQATAGWILQMENDGFSPVMQLTNEIYNSVAIPIIPGSTVGTSGIVGTFPGSGADLISPNYYSQSWQLTPNQIQNLQAGKWYAEVDYGDDKYIGNLTPVPSSVWPPKAVISVSPMTILPTGIGSFPGQITTSVVVAPDNNQPATVVFDGSESTDPYYLPLQFLWQDGINFSATTATTTNEMQRGSHQISLEVNDGYNSDTAYFTLEVVSPGEAVTKLALMVQQSNLSKARKSFFALILSQARNSFDRNNTISGVNQLKMFQNQIRLQIMRTENAAANWLIEGAQEIIDAVGKQPNRHPVFRF